MLLTHLPGLLSGYSVECCSNNIKADKLLQLASYSGPLGCSGGLVKPRAAKSARNCLKMPKNISKNRLQPRSHRAEKVLATAQKQPVGDERKGVNFRQESSAVESCSRKELSWR